MQKLLVLLFATFFAIGASAADKQKVIKVKTSEQFIKAIDSNRRIIVENDLLDMTETIKRMQLPEVDEDATGTMVSEEYDGPSLLIANVSNLTIEGKYSDTHIQVTPRYANVLAFASCENITMKNLKLGHTNTGDCVGNVVDTKYCVNVNIENCKLYGCGVEGVAAENTKNLLVTNSNIYECSFDGINLYSVDNATFSNCKIYDNLCDLNISGDCSDITFNDCNFYSNKNRLNFVRGQVTMNRCVIGDAEDNGVIESITFNDCKIDGELQEKYDECEDDYEGDGEGVYSYPYAHAEFSNSMKDITDYTNINYFTDREYLKAALYDELLDYIETNASRFEAEDIEKAKAFFNAEPLPIKANELLQFKRVRSIQFTDVCSVSYDFFNCRFYREDGELYFDKTSGSQRKWGLIGRINDNNLAFTGCWYIGGDKRTGFLDEEHLQEGVIKKVSSNKVMMLFKNDDRGFEIYEIVK